MTDRSFTTVRILLFHLCGVLALNFTAMSWYTYPRVQMAIWLIGGTALFVASMGMLREHMLIERRRMLTERIAALKAAIAQLEGNTP